MRCVGLLATIAGCGAPTAQPDATLDPTYTHASLIKAPIVHDRSHFGARVAMSGDGRTLAVAAPSDDSGQTGVASDGTDRSLPLAGSVHIFAATATGWLPQAYLKPAVAGEADQFGTSLGLSTLGDTLVVGAPGEGSRATGVGGDANDNAASGAGAAYVFKRHGLQWQQQAYLKASNTGGGDELGLAVAIAGDGNTVAVGAPAEDSDGLDQTSDAARDAGAVYVFTTDGETWAQAAYVKAANPVELDAFGGSVALSADGATLAVGASGRESAYVFHGAGGRWTQATALAAVIAHAGDGFGSAVALGGLGTTLVVGAPLEANHGAAYVFALTGATWAPAAHLAAMGTDDRFGAAVAISGDGKVVAASAPGDDAIAMDSGAVTIFDGPSYARATTVKAPTPHQGDRLGSAVALSGSGSSLAVGVALDNLEGVASGAVYDCH